MNEVTISTMDGLRGMLATYTSDRVVDEYTQFNAIERVSGVAKVKLILTALEVMDTDTFKSFKDAFNIDKTFVSKCKKCLEPIAIIEIIDTLNIANFSITQLIEMSAIDPDKLSEYLLNGTITHLTTCADIRKLAKVVDDIVENDENDDCDEVVENDANTPIETPEKITAGVVSVKISDIVNMLESDNIVDIKHMLGAYVHGLI